MGVDRFVAFVGVGVELTGGVSGLQGFIESEGGSDGEFLLGEGVLIGLLHMLVSVWS